MILYLLGDRNDETGNPFYLTYFKFNYLFTLLGLDAEPFAGLTPFCGLFAEKLAIVNIGISFSKSFSIAQGLAIPVSVTAISNPYQNKYFLVFCFGIVFLNLK